MKFLAVAVALALLPSLPVAPSRTRVVVLGTGTPNADPDRYGPAVAVVVDDASYLVDAGVGVVRRAAAAERAGVPALNVTKLKRVFITHLHSDHTLGLADLILSPWVLERDGPLEVYGPKGARSMVEHLVAAYAEDLRVRRTGGEPAHKYDPRVVSVHEIDVSAMGAGSLGGSGSPGSVIYKDPLVAITAFPVKHGAWEQAFGYRFQTPDRTVVVSGDTGPDSRIEDQCRRCDVLVHEVYSEAGLARRPAEWQAYHSRYHTSARQLGAIASRAAPGVLVLYHQLIWSSTEDELLTEVRSAFGGTVVSAKDLDVF
ncbi:MAG TPA: MBL fold metallo-hydrolase [Vicinamibacterales bacterium]|nr:MBL fold metallo-hydrolase [Vicinamibacterales bacterium]